MTLTKRNGTWLIGLMLLLNLLLWAWAGQLPIAKAGNDTLPASVQLELNKATPQFPDKINFEFKAQIAAGSPTFSKLELNFKLRGDVGSNIRTQTINKSASSISAKFEYDTQKDYTPPGTGFRFFWTLYDNSGKAYDTPIQEFFYQDERFSFQELKSGVVTVRWYQGDKVFGQSVLDKALQTIDKLGKRYNIEPTDPINITIYPDTRAMFTALPPNTAEWVGGQAIPALGTIALAIAPNDRREIGRSIPHEVSHMVVYQATRNPYNYAPKWLDEGLAVNNQDQVDAFLMQAFQRAFDQRSLNSLRVLGSSFPADPQLSYQSYGESVSMVQYLIKKYGEEKIGQLLNSFRQGLSYDEAMQLAFGVNLDTLDRQWKEALGYPLLPVPEAPQPTATPIRIILGTPAAASVAATRTPVIAASPTAAGSSGSLTGSAAVVMPANNTVDVAKNLATSEASAATEDNSRLTLVLMLAIAIVIVTTGVVALAIHYNSGKNAS